MKKLLTLTCVLALSAMVALTGCGAKETGGEEVSTSVIYNDGTYEGKSEPDPRGAYGIAKVELKGDKIVNASYKEYLQSGKEKDQDYGKIVNEKTGEIDQESYKKGQLALAGQGQYGGKLVEAQDINKVDVISGATHSHEMFKDAVNKALAQAKK